jgi:ribosomal protein S18 acetylase RimI-like enzyme
MAGYTDSMKVALREFAIGDYDAARSLWESAPGIGLSEADGRENIARFLDRNPGLSFVAEQEGGLVGALLCGNDGRRGFLHHLAVSAPHQRGGIGRALVERSLGALAAIGIRKCHIFVLADNQEGRRFWQRVGWQERTTLLVMSRDVE